MNLAIDMSIVRLEAAAFDSLPEESRAIIRLPILDGQPLSFYHGGYNAATYGVALALGNDDMDEGYRTAVVQVMWAYAAEIMKIVDAAGGVNTK